MQRRLLPHAQMCSQWVLRDLMGGKYRSDDTNNKELNRYEKNIARPDAIHLLGLLYVDQRKLAKAREMYQCALQGYKKTLGAEHTLTLATVNNLGIF